jgi:hypothetical protein
MPDSRRHEVVKDIDVDVGAVAVTDQGTQEDHPYHRVDRDLFHRIRGVVERESQKYQCHVQAYRQQEASSDQEELDASQSPNESLAWSEHGSTPLQLILRASAISPFIESG